jgi:outer membrane protein TolC
MRIGKEVVLALLFTAGVCEGTTPLTVDQIVDLAIAANPSVRSAEARWNSAQQSILPAYALADPTFSFFNLDTPTNGFSHPASLSFQISQPLGFPGKAYLQEQNADRSANLARLAYEATGEMCVPGLRRPFISCSSVTLLATSSSRIWRHSSECSK